MKEIILTQGKVALVDDEDFDRVNQFKWYAYRQRETWYARRKLSKSNGKTIRLHQFLLPGHKQIDHKDRDGLNCQKENLRPANTSQNNGNSLKRKNCSSKYKGVWLRAAGTWGAQIGGTGKPGRFLGNFKTEEAAARAYDTAAVNHFGEFARLNFPE